ncbi:MAG TPA: 3-oxoacyl-[acyl-carrier-protein] reductase [Candidatus Krumholzibacteria bacterium]|nr:3-oxoacyl-[acyl-carrier-protein] reductase [Candidatus Krumholzibacteria bacterium]HRX50697.1 3-oxoacyl-[acyl-carrier-protein] reductase [Candidatus Krumholzibacteria bacterium]
MSKGTVIVTGASRGIGEAIARRLAAEGYDLALVARSAERLQAVADSLEGEGRRLVFAADVSDAGAAGELVARIADELDPIYGLVNNAGITRDTLLLRMSEAQFREVLDVNLTGTFHLTKAVAQPMMRQKIGRIVNMSSVIGLTGNAGQANYAASKAGLIAFTKSVARELGGRNITVNAVAPGFIATDMTADLPEQVKTDMLKSIPLKRFGEGEDIAGAVAFLLSKDAAYITGQTLVVDGGMVT